MKTSREVWPVVAELFGLSQFERVKSCDIRLRFNEPAMIEVEMYATADMQPVTRRFSLIDADTDHKEVT